MNNNGKNVSRKALIREEYLKWVEKHPHADEYTLSTNDFEVLIESTESEGEAERLKTAIKEAMEKEWELAGEATPIYVILYQALSSTSETAVQPDIDAIVDHCSDLSHYDTEEHNSPECVKELNYEDQGECMDWVSDLLRAGSRMAIDMYLDEQGIKDGREKEKSPGSTPEE